ncbi:MAG: FadR/GntR family transcriptional regulator [Sphingomicrobium sp.]
MTGQKAKNVPAGEQLFSKTLKRRAYEDIVEQIERAILTGEMNEADRLPSERDLIEQFGVSRATIREALRVLQSRGLIEVRHGDPGGPIVRANPGASVATLLNALFRADRLTLADVIQFRMLVESAAAALAAKSPPRSIAAIRRAYSEMEATTTWNEQVQSDVLFHRRIAEASKNPLFVLVVDALHQFRPVATWLAKRSLDDARRQTLEVHGMILDAIEAGNAKKAAELSRYHLRKSYRPILSKIERDRLNDLVSIAGRESEEE